MNDKTKARLDRLYAFGLKWNGSEFFMDDINVHWTEITCDTDEDFDNKVSAIEHEINRRKEVNV